MNRMSTIFRTYLISVALTEDSAYRCRYRGAKMIFKLSLFRAGQSNNKGRKSQHSPVKLERVQSGCN